MPPVKMPLVTAKTGFVMPRPPAVVVWTNAPGVPPTYAIVTAYGKQGVSLLLFPPDSRVGVPKDAVRFIDDPWNKANGINPDSGVWDYTEESRELAAMKVTLDMLTLAAHTK